MRLDASEAYDAWHRAQGLDSGDAPWHRLLKPLLTDLAGKRVLEVGCGTGGFTVWLGALPAGERPTEVVACDLSPVAIAMAREVGRSRRLANVHYRVGDVMELDWATDAFDVVISCETIEHVSSPQTAVRELARALRVGGKLYLTCPNYLNLMGLYRLYLPLTGRRFSEGGQPIARFLLLPRVRRWVRAHLEIERTMGVGHYVPFPRRSPIRLTWADRLGHAGTYAALHTLIVARSQDHPDEMAVGRGSANSGRSTKGR